jgi:hypothetical protein
MDVAPDELAGIADLFGGLTRAELYGAIENVAARQGVAFDRADLQERIEAARREYYLLAVEEEGKTVLVPGPAALPSLPDHAEDLPHMMDVPERTIEPERLADAALERLAADAERAIAEGDGDRVAFLIDVCYDAEAWGPVEVDPIRDRLLEGVDAE